jgi:hypothetical protein
MVGFDRVVSQNLPIINRLGKAGVNKSVTLWQEVTIACQDGAMFSKQLGIMASRDSLKVDDSVVHFGIIRID